MIWLTWRQLRLQVMVVGAAAALLLVLLAVTGPGLADMDSSAGGSLLDQISQAQQVLYYAGLVAVLLLPAAIGMFWGAPLVTRELESGTHQLAWNQSVTRTRWLVAKLGVTAPAAMAVAGLTSLAVTWWSRPIDQAVNSGGNSEYLPRIAPLVFGSRGVVPLAFAAFAFVLGVALGLLIRRTVPAMATVLVLFLAVQIVMPLWVRPHLATPAQVTVPFSKPGPLGIQEDGSISMTLQEPGGWLVAEQTVNPAGRPSAVPASFGNCLRAAGDPPPPQAFDTCFKALTALGYGQRLTYQPADNFWTLQWAETGIYLVLTLGLGGVCVWRIRRLS